MIDEYDIVRQIAVVRYCSRKYTIEELAYLLTKLSKKTDISKIYDGLTMLWEKWKKISLLQKIDMK